MGINIKEQDRILVVAPHPDDESIGCGGLLSIYGKQCDVLVITDGDSKNGETDIADIRESEFERAISLTGVRNHFFLRIPERKINLFKDRISEIKFSEYNHIFVPNRYDEHKDHVAVYKIIKRLVNKKSKLYEYEVWTPLRIPNIYVDISEVSENKINMIKAHESQVAELDYVGMIMGLNVYRGRSHGYEFAECYYCAKEMREQKIRRFKRKLRKVIEYKVK